MRGEIHVTSRVGAGSTFTVKLLNATTEPSPGHPAGPRTDPAAGLASRCLQKENRIHAGTTA